MQRSPVSAFRVATRSAFLAVALFLALVFWYLPNLLNLDAFRQPLTEFLQKTFRCRVLVGHVQGELVPSPGFVVRRVVFLMPEGKPLVLASVDSVHLWVSMRALLMCRLGFSAVRFAKPRFIFHRLVGASGESYWAGLTLPAAKPEGGGTELRQWDIRSGSVEVWDHASSPTAKWVINGLSGFYRAPTRTAALAGTVLELGPHCNVAVHYEGSQEFPIALGFNMVDLETLQKLTGMRRPALHGLADIDVKAQIQPAITIRATLQRAAGAGTITTVAQAGAHGRWRWTATAQDFLIDNTAFRLPHASAHGALGSTTVQLQAATPEGGMGAVAWEGRAGAKDSTLRITVRSIPIRQILEIFDVRSKVGYEAWTITQGSLDSVLHAGSSFEVRKATADIAGMHLEMTGAFDLGTSSAATARQGHIQGSLQNIAMEPIVTSFFPPPAPMTGIGRANFTLAFPLSNTWVQGLSGPLEVEIDNGVLHSLKAIYQIVSVLNLGNYLRLRFPKFTAEGIEFHSIIGRLDFQNGVLSTENLFLKSPNMNVGADGDVDIPHKRVDLTLRLEMFRFLEDILKDVPITHWIFKKPNKIFLPLVVDIGGPWDNPTID